MLGLLWSVSARAAEPTIQLPSGESETLWREPLATAGLTPTSSVGASVRVVVVDGRWSIQFVDATGARSVEVPTPSTEADREAIAWLAGSLVAPLDLSGLPRAPATSPAVATAAPAARVAVRTRVVTPSPVPVTATPGSDAVGPTAPLAAPTALAPTAPIAPSPGEADAVADLPASAPAAIDAVASPASPDVARAPESPWQTGELAPAPPPAVVPAEVAEAPREVEQATPEVARPHREVSVQASVVAAAGVGLQGGVAPGAAGRVGAGVVLLEHLVVRAGVSLSGPTRPTEPVVADGRATVGVWGTVGWEAPWTWAPSVTASCGGEHLSFAQDGAVISSGWMPECGAGLGLLRALPANLSLGVEARVRQELRGVTVRVDDALVSSRSATAFDVGLTLLWRSRARSRPE